MINNRQSSRNRRGRGGPRPVGGPQGPRSDNGNRMDSRQRGNAHQLHEKYKTLARDAQMQGDRVTAEYYLQFADHYFRVLNEHRARQEEQRERQQRQYESRHEDHGNRDDHHNDGEDPTAPIAEISGLPPAIGSRVSLTDDADEHGPDQIDQGDDGAEDEKPRGAVRGRAVRARQPREREARNDADVAVTEVSADEGAASEAGDDVRTSAPRARAVTRRRTVRASSPPDGEIQLEMGSVAPSAEEEAPKVVRRPRRTTRKDPVEAADA